MKSIKIKLLIVFMVVFVAAAAYAAGSGMFFGTSGAMAQSAVLYSKDTIPSVYTTVSPSVVEIRTTQSSNGFFGGATQGQGSGFLIDGNGNILTNNHVIAGASSVKVKFANGNVVDGKVAGSDATFDLAVVSVSSTPAGTSPLQLADSDKVVPGQLAIAIGNPYGLDNTITVGVISGLNRSVSGSALRGMLQTDASINPGNSGGPLLDAEGKVIGVNTAIEAPSTGARGIGFAVPSNIVKSVIPDLIAGKAITRAWLGISGITVDQTLASNLKLTVSQGAYIISVVKDSPAEKAGLKGGNTDSSGSPVSGGDLITAIDGKLVKTIDDLSGYIQLKKSGEQVKLSLLRNGQNLDILVTLGERPANLSISPGTQPQPSPVLPTPRFRFRNSVPGTPSN